MQWAEIRRQYAEQWLLLEAIAAHSESNQRVLDQLAVIATYADSPAALRKYAHLHHREPQRELYVLHTSQENLLIRERWWHGIHRATN